MTVPEQQSDIERVAGFLRSAKSVFVITGAGISAESGLPTYRGVGGLYNDKNTDDGMTIEKALSGPMFRTRPEVTWKYLGQIEEATRGATFNDAHSILAAMEKHFQRFWVLTQNIDGFHSSAGSANVIEIHGNMHRLKCTQCDYLEIKDDYIGMSIPPECPNCGSMARPDVVLFEEMLPEKEIQKLYHATSQPFDTVISIGTSSHFPYIIEPIIRAHQANIPTVEINPTETHLSDTVDVHLKMGAKAALEAIWEKIS